MTLNDLESPNYSVLIDFFATSCYDAHLKNELWLKLLETDLVNV